jgi:hypothetical protein
MHELLCRTKSQNMLAPSPIHLSEQQSQEGSWRVKTFAPTSIQLKAANMQGAAMLVVLCMWCQMHAIDQLFRAPIRKRGKYPAVQFAKNMHRHTQKKIQTDVATCSRRPTTSEPTQRRAFSPTHGRLASTAAQNRNGQACAVSRHAQACTVARKRITAEFTV